MKKSNSGLKESRKYTNYKVHQESDSIKQVFEKGPEEYNINKIKGKACHNNEPYVPKLSHSMYRIRSAGFSQSIEKEKTLK